MNAMTFIAFAKPYNLLTTLYIEQDGENVDFIQTKVLDIIEHLSAEDDYKDILRKTLSIWTTDIWKKVIFEGMGF